MLIFDKLELVFLAAPKSGSTSFEKAFESYANPELSGALPKHARYSRYRKHFPDLAEKYEAIAVLRDPLEVLHSWYRYRSRWTLFFDSRSTKRVSFEDFYEAWCKGGSKAFANMNPSVNFMVDGKGEQFPGLKVLRYADTALLHDHMRGRLGIETEVERRNVSPDPTEGLLAAAKRVWGGTPRSADRTAVTSNLDDLKSRIDLDHPKLRKAYKLYDRIRFTEVADLRSSPLSASPSR